MIKLNFIISIQTSLQSVKMFRKIPLDHKIQSIFPIALTVLLLLGASRLLLENSRTTKHLQDRRRDENHMLPVIVSPEDRIDEECNVFEGEWVRDNTTYPLYTEESCPYLVKQVTCQKNGRPDSFYKNWRWQPNSCKLPRFDPLKLLDVLRGKRLMFVGDSIQRGQFESLVCMIQSAVPHGKKTLERIPPKKIFKIEDYNASIEYYWAPFIVESISDHATNHTVLKRLVKLDSIGSHGIHWEGVDVLVFESYVWWMHKPLINASYGNPDNVREYNVSTAYRLALETWAKWIESTINPVKQQVYFMTMSPTHLWSWEWNKGSDQNCYGESYPIQHPYWGTGSGGEIMEIVGEILQRLKKKVTLLNITQLSEYRKDGHTSIYGERKGKLLTKEQRSQPKIFADCIHWCLPGVPDAWNELLYAYLLKNHHNFW